MRSLRLLPVVILTSLMLLGMKGFNLIAGPGHSVSGVELARAQDAGQQDAEQAEPMAGEDDGEAANMEETMTEDGMAEDGMDMAAEDAGDAADTPMADAEAASEPPEDQSELPIQTSREALLERLGERRVLIEEREQDLRIREQLLAAAERRLEERLAELEALEERVTAVADAEEERESEEIARLVQVYSAMRPKDAAAIFDLLDLPILMDVANAMNPRKMADILGEMTPESARQLTVALAGTPAMLVPEPTTTQSTLPRIDGVPVE